MDGFKKRTAKKRAAILRAVLSLMMEKQSTFTIQDVAMAASVSPVSIYNYFGSKEQLMLAALELSMEEQIEEIDREMSRHCPFEELLRRILMKKIDHAAMFDSVLIDLVTTNEALQRMTKIGYASLLRLIDYGRTEGAIAEDMSNETFLRYVQLLQRAILSDPELSRASVDTMMRDYFQLFFYGIIARP